MIETIRSDPSYNHGDYTTQPNVLKFAAIFYGIATAGGTLRYEHIAPTREKADQFLNARLSAPFGADANDWIWQWSSSADYDAMPEIEKIQASVLAINSADDERNPPELGVMEREIKRVKHGRVLIIPASADTAGHGTTAQARWWKGQLAELLAKTPKPAF